MSAYPTPVAVASFWSGIEEDRVGCWIWRRGLRGSGYGSFQAKTPTGRKASSAHRFAYELLIGPIPEGLDLDHLCRNRACCNPGHLEPVTRAENLRRGKGAAVTQERWAAQTHCKNGHPLSGENLRMEGRNRICRTCLSRKERERRAVKPPCPKCGGPISHNALRNGGQCLVCRERERAIDRGDYAAHLNFNEERGRVR